MENIFSTLPLKDYVVFVDYLFIFAIFFIFLSLAHFKSVILIVRYNLAFVFAFLFSNYLLQTKLADNYLTFISDKYHFLFLLLSLTTIFTLALKKIDFNYNLLRAWSIKILIASSASLFTLMILAHIFSFNLFNYNFGTELSLFLLSDGALLLGSAILFFAISLF